MTVPIHQSQRTADLSGFWNAMVILSVITIVGEIGAFSFALLCAFLGYRLFVIQADGAFKLGAGGASMRFYLESVAPGLLFALMGAVIAGVTIVRCVGAGTAITLSH